MFGSSDDVMLCGSCGQVKGAETCCAEGAADCMTCGLDKGSPGCCKMEKGEDVTLCNGCGSAAGSDAFWELLRDGREGFTQFGEGDLRRAGVSEADLMECWRRRRSRHW